MRLVFDDEALDDLRRIFARIAKSNQPAAERLVARIFDKVECLLTPELKQMGRPGRDPGTRELIEWPKSSSLKSMRTAI
jgi:plasmid stabilization system protein ParE